MKHMLLDAWRRDKRGFLSILVLNIVVSLTGGISIVMLIPMLGLLDISAGAASTLALFIAPLKGLPYGAQVTVMIALYFGLVVIKSLLSRMLMLRENEYLENYSYNLRSELYKAVSNADWRS